MCSQRKSNEEPPLSALASSPTRIVPTKTFDGGSHPPLLGSFDAFQHYSDDRVRMDVLMMRRDGQAPSALPSSGSGAGRWRQQGARNATAATSAATRPHVERRTAISFELHPDAFLFDDTRILYGTTDKAPYNSQ